MQALPFEIHLTIQDLDPDREAAFIAICTMSEAKPMVIELSQGSFLRQPMLSKVVYESSIDDVLAVATQISARFAAGDFKVVRLKIEVPATMAAAFASYETSFARYFEWHGKIDFHEPDSLQLIGHEHRSHLSLNALKHDANTRFITLREFGAQEVFDERVAGLCSALAAGGWPVLKQQAEYCIYDNNTFLDNGWLPQ